MTGVNGQEPEFKLLQIAGEIEPNADGGYTVSIGGENFQVADVAEALAMLTEVGLSAEADEELEL